MNERIRLLRKELGLNQSDFGNKIGVKQGTVAGYESGARTPLDAVVSSICREFDVNEEWLRTGEGEMFEQMTEQQKLLKYTGMLLKDKDSAIVNAIQSFIVTYEQLDDTSKATLEKIAQQSQPASAHNSPDPVFSLHRTLCVLHRSGNTAHYKQEGYSERWAPSHI